MKAKLNKNKKDDGDAQINDPDFDKMSNLSDESLMSMATVDRQRGETKMARVEENVDIKLNRYLMKW